MMRKLTLLFILFVLAANGNLFAQDKETAMINENPTAGLSEKERKAVMNKDFFDEVFRSVSPKKTSIITLKDGKTYRGYCKDLDRKKGQIYNIELKDSITGQKLEFAAPQIAEMYLFPSGFEKFNKASSYFHKASKWGRRELTDITSKGYIYYKNQSVSLKNKKETKEYLMQLINPSFSSVIEVYGDPNAGETGGVAVGFGGGPMSPQLGGGVTKSYYFKKGDKIFWLHKSDFEEHYNELFGDNPEFIFQYPYNKVDWKNLSFLVFEYTRMAETQKGN